MGIDQTAEKATTETKLVILSLVGQDIHEPEYELFKVPKSVPCGVRYVIDKTIQLRGKKPSSGIVYEWIISHIEDNDEWMKVTIDYDPYEVDNSYMMDKRKPIESFHNLMKSDESRNKFIEYFMKLDFTDFVYEGNCEFREVEPAELV